MAFFIVLPAYKKKQEDKALKGSDSKLEPILEWALIMNIRTIFG